MNIDPNAHNPIARCIEKMQRKWIDAVEAQPNYTLARWLIAEEESELLNGFCKLESSEHGQLPEIFITLFTSYDDSFSYSQQLIIDWLAIWDKNEKHTTKITQDWGYDYFKQKAASEQVTDDILIQFLQRFHNAFGDEERPVVLSLLPKTISNNVDYVQWAQNIAIKLPASVKLMVVDYIEKDNFQKTCYKLKDKAITIPCGDLNIKEAIKKIATSGNPNAPEVQFKKCLFAMGEAIVAKNRTDLDKWGEKALNIAQRSGVKSFYATAHLAYAGFMMQLKLKDEKIKPLLENGVRIAKTAPKDDATATIVLGQLYTYLSAWYQGQGENNKAAEYLIQHTEIAIQLKHELQAIISFRRAGEIYKQNHNTDKFLECVTLGYKTGETLSDELLILSVDYALLGRDYHNLMLQQKQIDKAEQINNRMSNLYGNDWKDSIISQTQSRKSSVTIAPNINIASLAP